MNPVRIGIVGVGNMGATHARSILGGRVEGLQLTALADLNPAMLAPFPGVAHFENPLQMLSAGLIDAALIATPHFDHVPLGIAALAAGLHVLIEKPLAVHKADAERFIAAVAAHPGQICAAMFNQRTDDYYQTIRRLIQSGELGEIRRMNWLVTDWFRPAAYYASSEWRATWAGEGGGVLLNQSLHNLDLLQWLLGQPVRIRAHAGFGRYHEIEVEDDVTAYLEFSNGATGVFVTSTGESPGSNRLEIAGERGRLVYEADTIRLWRNAQPTSVFSGVTTELFARPPTSEENVAVSGHGGQHNEVLQNFVDAIQRGVPLIAPAGEGIHSVEIVNAMLMSAWTNKTVELPLDGSAYARLLDEKIRSSRRKPFAARPVAPADLSRSFGT